MSHPANTKLSLSSEGVLLIKRFESLRHAWYVCPAGKLTIGYGHVKRPVDVFTAPISTAFAEALLRQDLAEFESAVYEEVMVPLSQGQFDALVSLAFNIGNQNFKTSTLLKKLNAGDKNTAAEQFLKWVYARKIRLSGLVARRTAERQLFLLG